MSASTCSKLRSALRTGTRNLLASIEADIGSSREIVVDKGKLLFNYLRLLSSAPLHLSNVSSHSNQSESIVGKKNSFSLIERLYRVSLPVPPFPSCELQRVSMASLSSKDLLSGQWAQNLRHGQLEKPKSCNNLSFDFKAGNRHGKVFMSLRDAEKPDNFLVYGYLSYNVYKRSSYTSRHVESGARSFHSSGLSCGSADPAGDVVFDNASSCTQSSRPVDRPEPKIPVERSMKLISGSCYLPHPDKEDTGGEDAHFICEEEQAIGVADGVGGWADVGINAGLFARELMLHSANAVQEEPKGDVDPVRVLTKAHSSTKAKGSSTACIIALTEKGLRAINLGDSGFMVVRDGSTIFRSPVQQHDFNFTYQLESGIGGDLPSSGQVFTILVTTGDVMVAGTDGLFDNLYNSEVTTVVVQATRAGLGPQAAAQNIAALARQRALDKDRQTPFSTAAQDAGFRYYGGKLDDITVVVSYITGSTEVQLKSGSG